MAISSWPKKLKRLPCLKLWVGWNMSRSNISNIGFQETKLGGSETPNSGFTFQTPVPLIARIEIFIACGSLGRQIPATKIQLFEWCPSQRLQKKSLGIASTIWATISRGSWHHLGMIWHITLGALWLQSPEKSNCGPATPWDVWIISFRIILPFFWDGNDNSVKPPTSQNLVVSRLVTPPPAQFCCSYQFPLISLWANS